MIGNAAQYEAQGHALRDKFEQLGRSEIGRQKMLPIWDRLRTGIDRARKQLSDRIVVDA